MTDPRDTMRQRAFHCPRWQEDTTVDECVETLRDVVAYEATDHPCYSCRIGVANRLHCATGRHPSVTQVELRQAEWVPGTKLRDSPPTDAQVARMLEQGSQLRLLDRGEPADIGKPRARGVVRRRKTTRRG